MKWRQVIFALLCICPLIIVLAVSFGNDPHKVPSVLEGKPAPTFILPNITQQTVNLHDFLGKPVVLNFWSTWCEPCKDEYALLQQAAEYYQDKVQFIGIVYQDTPFNVRSYLNTQKNLFPHLLDTDSKVAIAYGVSGVPESFFIDRKGFIKHKISGVLTASVLKTTLDTMVQSP